MGKYVLPTINPELTVRLSEKVKDDGSVALRGTLCDSDKNTLYPASSQTPLVVRGSAGTKAEVPIRVQHVVAKLLQKYQDLCPDTPAAVNMHLTFAERWDNLSDKEKDDLCPHSWKAESTKNNRLTYFSRQLISRLDQFGDTINMDDMATISEALLVECQKGAAPHIAIVIGNAH